MNDKLEQQLMDEFPFMEARNVWTGEKLNYPVSCECQDGWYDLIYNICKGITDLYNDKNVDISEIIVIQIKEKFGSLNIYTGGLLSEAFNILHKYEDLSKETCEVCGDKGELMHQGGWYKTLCDKHGIEYKYKKFENGEI